MRHDFDYWRGVLPSGDPEYQRWRRDRIWLGSMMQEANRYRGWRRAFYRSVARAYYTVVRAAGKSSFNDDWPRTSFP